MTIDTDDRASIDATKSSSNLYPVDDRGSTHSTPTPISHSWSLDKSSLKASNSSSSLASKVTSRNSTPSPFEGIQSHVTGNTSTSGTFYSLPDVSTIISSPTPPSIMTPDKKISFTMERKTDVDENPQKVETQIIQVEQNVDPIPGMISKQISEPFNEVNMSQVGSNDVKEQREATVSLITNWLTQHVEMERSFIYNSNLWIYMSKDTLFEYDIKAHKTNASDTSLTGWKKHVIKPSDKFGYPCCNKGYKLLLQEDSLYIHGGVNYRDRGFTRIWRLDLKLKKWRRVGAEEADVFAVPTFDSAVIHNNDIICFGKSFNGAVYRLSAIDGTQWIDKEKNHQQPRSFHSALIFNNKMYVYGGLVAKANEGTSSIAVYDFTELRWSEILFTSKDYIPRGRYGHSANLYMNRYMLIYGGCHSKKPLEYADPCRIELFDLETGKWILGGIKISPTGSEVIVRTFGRSVVPSFKNVMRQTTACENRTRHQTLIVGNRACVLGGIKSSGKSDKRVDNIAIIELS